LPLFGVRNSLDNYRGTGRQLSIHLVGISTWSCDVVSGEFPSCRVVPSLVRLAAPNGYHGVLVAHH
jgi:hypothetical protein